MYFAGKVVDFRNVELNGGHRLARDLRFMMLDCGGFFRELVNGETAVMPTYQGGSPTALTDGLLGPRTGLAAVTAVFDDVSTNTQISGSKSWAAGIIKVASAGAYARPFGRTANNGGSAPYENFGFSINWNSEGQTNVRATAAAQSSTLVTSGGGADLPGDNIFTTLIGTASTTNNVRLYVDGLLKQTGASSISSLPSYDTNAKLLLNGSSDAAVSNQGGSIVYFGAVAAREWDADEALELNDLLFDDSASGLLVVPTRRSYFFAGTSPPPPPPSTIPVFMHHYRQQRAA